MKKTYYFKKFNKYFYEDEWECELWETKEMPAKRAAFLWKAMLREHPELITEYSARFNPAGRYQLYIEMGRDTEYKPTLKVYRVYCPVRKLDESRKRQPRRA